MAAFSIDMNRETFMIAPFDGVSRPNAFFWGSQTNRFDPQWVRPRVR